MKPNTWFVPPGYLQGIGDLAAIPLGVNASRARHRCCRTSRKFASGRRCAVAIADLDGEGEVVGGGDRDAVGRERVGNHRCRERQRLAELSRTACPTASKIVVTYDRSDLIERSVDTLEKTNWSRSSSMVALVCAVFLFPPAVV